MSNSECHVREENAAEGEHCSIECSAVPLRRPEATVRESTRDGGRHLVFVEDRENMFYINGTAREIFEMCNGGTNVSQMISQMQTTYQCPSGVDMDSAVRKYLLLLQRTGAIQISEVEK